MSIEKNIFEDTYCRVATAEGNIYILSLPVFSVLFLHNEQNVRRCVKLWRTSVRRNESLMVYSKAGLICMLILFFARLSKKGVFVFTASVLLRYA
jgi:hypothetical protein